MALLEAVHPARRGARPRAGRRIRLRDPRRANSSRCSAAMAPASRCCCARWRACARRAAAGCCSMARDIHDVAAARYRACGSASCRRIPDAAPQGIAARSVLLGRFAHLGLLGSSPAPTDDERVARALADVGLASLDDARARRRCRAANSAAPRSRACWCRRPSLYLLDEPTNHLDPAQQIGILARLRALAHAGAAVIASLHDPNLALRFADRAWLLSGDGRVEIVDCAALGAAASAAPLRPGLRRGAHRRDSVSWRRAELLAVADHAVAQRLRGSALPLRD